MYNVNYLEKLEFQTEFTTILSSPELKLNYYGALFTVKLHISKIWVSKSICRTSTCKPLWFGSFRDSLPPCFRKIGIIFFFHFQYPVWLVQYLLDCAIVLLFTADRLGSHALQHYLGLHLVLKSPIEGFHFIWIVWSLLIKVQTKGN